MARTGESLYTDLAAWRGITAGILKGYKAWALQQGMTIGTLNVRLATLKRYSALALEADILTADEYARIDQVKGYTQKAGHNIDQERTITHIGLKKAEPTVISPAHAKLLKQQPATRKGRRDALMVCFVLDHGFRCSEVTALTVAHLDLVEATITMYREKVQLWQIHDLSSTTLHVAQAYLPDVAGQEWLFPGNKEKRTGKVRSLTTRAINDRVSVLGQRVGIKERFGPMTDAITGRPIS